MDIERTIRVVSAVGAILGRPRFFTPSFPDSRNFVVRSLFVGRKQRADNVCERLSVILDVEHSINGCMMEIKLGEGS
jgi:hypothetical protein